MIIKAKPFPISVIIGIAYVLSWFLRLRFNKMIIKDTAIKEGYSMMLMCNHFSFWDGFWAIYLCLHAIHKKRNLKGIYIMTLKKQLQMNPWLRYFGGFSIDPGKASVNESLDYAARILSTPGNLL